MKNLLDNIDTEEIGGALIVLLVVLFFGCLLYSAVDCAQGTSLETTGQLVDKYHRASWNEQKITMVQNKSGFHQRIETVYHPEQFVLRIYDGDGGRDIEVEGAIWFHYKTGDWVKMRKRFGKRSKCKCRETVL